LASLLLATSFIVVLYSMGLRAAYHNHLLCTVGAFLGLAAWPQFKSELYWRVSNNKNTAQTLALLDHSQMRGKPMLTEDPALAIFVGGIPAMVDATTILNMARAEPKKLSPLLEEIKHAKYVAIIMDSRDANLRCARIWPKEVVYATWRNYKLVGVTSGNGSKQNVFLPLKIQNSPSPPIGR